MACFLSPIRTFNYGEQFLLEIQDSQILNLNQGTDSKFIVKMTRTKGYRNAKKVSSTLDWRFHQKKKKYRTKGFF
jgi:hypothetical protein